MKATTPPRACASARTCWQTVVLPDDSGPKISVIRPRGMPPTPSARSSAIEPVGIVSSTSFSRDPSFMIAPRPNCFSIVARAASTALPRSAVFRSAARSSVIAICPSRSSSDPSDRSPERTRWRPPVDQPSSASSSTTVSFLARLADHLDVLRWLRQRRQARLGALRLRLLLPLCSAGLASPSLRLRVVLQPTDRSFTPTSRRLHRRLSGPREGAVRTSRRGRFRPGSRLGSWP